MRSSVETTAGGRSDTLFPPIFYRRGKLFLPALPYAQSIFTTGGIPNEPDSHWKLHRTQEQLAQQLGVSNKTISKWENGTCMPDYSIIQKLCDAIHVTLPELMDGEDAAEDSVRVYDDEQILDLLRRTQELERQKGVLCGFVLIVLGIASSALSRTTGGTDVQDFLSGILMGLSVAEILVGIWAAGKKLLKQ